MLERWCTRRFLRDDAARLRTTRGAVTKHLEDRGSDSSGREPLSGATRPDVFTYHFNQGRGARWAQSDRDVLWLLAFDDRHDAGYDHALALQADGTLYPELDPEWTRDEGTLLPWNINADEDSWEWASLVFNALTSFEAHADALTDGEAVDVPGSVHLRLEKDDDDVWTLTLRRRLAYQSEGSQRARWLRNDEIRGLFDHITRLLDPEAFEWDNPPHPQNFLFVTAYFFGRPKTPSEWLAYVAEHAVSGDALPLLHAPLPSGR